MISFQFLAIQETHQTDIEHITYHQKDRKYELFISECTSKYHGVGFIVKSELNPVFHKLSDRVIKCDITLQEEKRSRKILIINVYAPHSQITKKDIKQTEDLYNIYQVIS